MRGVRNTPERFWAQTERVGDCLEWRGTPGPHGYGQTSFEGRQWLAHRLAYFLATGVHPGGGVVRHSCDNPPCIEPSHLLLGTHADNVADKVARGHQRRGDTHPGRKLSSTEVGAIRARLVSGVQQKDLAVEYGVSRQQMSRIARGERWKKGA